MASSGWAWSRWVAARVLTAFTSFNRWITPFRNAAITSAELPFRTREASSPNVTSRTWCDWFSIAQCARIQCIKSNAVARVESKLVRSYSTDTVSPPSIRRTRSTRTTC